MNSSVLALRRGKRKLAPASLMRRVSKLDLGARHHAASAAAILVFTMIFFAPLLSGRTFSMVGAHMYAQFPWVGVIKNDPEVGGRGYPQTDHAETFYPASVFATNALRRGQFPLWLPYSFSGVPILEVGIGTGLLYPPKLLLMLFLTPIDQHNVILFTHLLVAGLGMYALLRCWGANAFGAVLGAIVWELNGHNAFWLTMEHAAIAAAWFPLMMLGATLAINRQSFRWAVAAGIALGVSVLSGIMNHVYLSIYVFAFWYVLLTTLAARKFFLKGQRKSALLCLSLPVISAMVAIVLSAASWLAMLDLLSNVHREPQTLEIQLTESIPISEFTGALIRPDTAVTGPAGKDPETESFAYVGIPALFLALCGLFRRSIASLFALVVCALSVGFMLGIGWVLVSLRSIIPYFGAIHLGTGGYFFCFAMAVLAAFGTTEAGRYLSRVKLHRYAFWGIGSLLIAIESWQLIMFGWTINPMQPARPEWLFPETTLIKKTQELQESYHILPVYYRHPTGLWWPPVLAGKVAATFDLRSGSGYESLLPLPTAALWRTVELGGALARDVPPRYRPYFYHDLLPINLLEKVSVGLLVAPPNTWPRDINGSDPMSDGALKLVYKGPDGWIYKLNRALPRAFLAPKVLTASDAPTSLKMFVDQKFDANQAAIVIGEESAAKTGLPSGDSPSGAFTGTATLISDQLNDLEIESLAPRAAMMVLNDSWDPGWKAYVDGVKQPVLRVNYAFRGVVVPEGKHRVVFLYRPTALLIGLWVSAGALLSLIILFAVVGVGSVRRLYVKPSSIDS